MVSTDDPQPTAPEPNGPNPIGPAPGGAADDVPRSRVAEFLPKTSRGWIASVAALVYLGGAIGYMVGVRSDRPPGRSSIDVGFLQDMISHHEQAIEMSNIELAGGAEPDVEAFAREILGFQAYEIGVMEGLLAEWGHHPEDRSETAMAWMDDPVPVDEMPGLASGDEMHRLGGAEGRDVDSLFVALMQDHHRGGIHMADYAAGAASDPSVRQLAARMARNQRIEVGELDAARQRANLDPAPSAYVPAEIPTAATHHHDHDTHG